MVYFLAKETIKNEKNLMDFSDIFQVNPNENPQLYLTYIQTVYLAQITAELKNLNSKCDSMEDYTRKIEEMIHSEKPKI